MPEQVSSSAAQTRVTCPADNCDVLVERGGMWTEDCSRFCDSWDRHVHTHCDGIARIFDQDGPSRYVCRCYCHQRQA